MTVRVKCRLTPLNTYESFVVEEYDDVRKVLKIQGYNVLDRTLRYPKGFGTGSPDWDNLLELVRADWRHVQAQVAEVYLSVELLPGRPNEADREGEKKQRTAAEATKVHYTGDGGKEFKVLTEAAWQLVLAQNVPEVFGTVRVDAGASVRAGKRTATLRESVADHAAKRPRNARSSADLRWDLLVEVCKELGIEHSRAADANDRAKRASWLPATVLAAEVAFIADVTPQAAIVALCTEKVPMWKTKPSCPLPWMRHVLMCSACAMSLKDHDPRLLTAWKDKVNRRYTKSVTPVASSGGRQTTLFENMGL
eukprot:TRINITY_DN2705_c0_g1_i6.p1 TRINITY_DN2705_c0_g1~~TRINITY_DN2705_c0_g1_i6.p1  ORF type:complete len:309 (-),score=95.41 TRINITY_DN2705_c0_g1_i6:363-1289(-)